MTRIGVNNLRSLALSVGAFESFRPARRSPASRSPSCSTHSTLVARIARRIAPKGMGDDAFTAGMLHDVGVLVLASKKPDQLADAIEMARTEGIPVYSAEQQTHGATHAEIGAHLLDLWGIPHPIVEAVAYHHAPGKAAGRLLDQVTAVYVADRSPTTCRRPRGGRRARGDARRGLPRLARVRDELDAGAASPPTRPAGGVD